MSLGFSFYAKTDSVSMFQQALEKLTATHGYHVMHYGTSSVVNFCKLGDLFYYYESQEGDDKVVVNGDCQTNLLGAGFHKAAIEFVDELQAATDIQFSVEDETGYYSEHDFDSLKNSHFHKWLKMLHRPDDIQRPSLCQYSQTFVGAISYPLILYIRFQATRRHLSAD